MNAAPIVISGFVGIGITALFIIPVAIALELMVASFTKRKWLHGIPIVAGIAIAAPILYMAQGYGWTIEGGIPMTCVVFFLSLCLSSLGTWLGYIISKRMSK